MKVQSNTYRAVINCTICVALVTILIFGASVGGVYEAPQSEEDIANSIEWYLLLRNEEMRVKGNTDKFDKLTKDGYTIDKLTQDLETLNESWYEQGITNEVLYKDMKKAIDKKDYNKMRTYLTLILRNAGLKETPISKERELDKFERDIANKVTPSYAYSQMKTGFIEEEVANLSLQWLNNSFVQALILSIFIGVIAVYPLFKFVLDERKLKQVTNTK